MDEHRALAPTIRWLSHLRRGSARVASSARFQGLLLVA
jgi:hypothetical protein